MEKETSQRNGLRSRPWTDWASSWTECINVYSQPVVYMPSSLSSTPSCSCEAKKKNAFAESHATVAYSQSSPSLVKNSEETSGHLIKTVTEQAPSLPRIFHKQPLGLTSFISPVSLPSPEATLLLQLLDSQNETQTFDAPYDCFVLSL